MLSRVRSLFVACLLIFGAARSGGESAVDGVLVLLECLREPPEDIGRIQQARGRCQFFATP
jgi:hypothetical protein